jgi:hypothetical protein
MADAHVRYPSALRGCIAVPAIHEVAPFFVRMGVDDQDSLVKVFTSCIRVSYCIENGDSRLSCSPVQQIHHSGNLLTVRFEVAGVNVERDTTVLQVLGILREETLELHVESQCRGALAGNGGHDEFKHYDG